MKFKIINGTVFDPSQKINNEKLDIFVSDGKIVKPSKSELSDFKKTYDAKGMYVMAGGNRYTFSYCWWKCKQCKNVVSRDTC